MKRLFRIAAAGLLFSGFLFTGFTFDKTATLVFGPDWPSDPKGTSWNASLNSGMMFEDLVGVGIGMDFLWKNESEKESLSDTGSTSSSRTITVKKEQYYMFPLYGYIEVDPAPSLIVHPVISLSAGVNIMTYSKDTLDRNDPDFKLKKADDANGFYFGPIMKLGIHGIYYFGETVGAKLGFTYRWSTPTKEAEEGWNYERKMSGAGLHLGFIFRL